MVIRVTVAFIDANSGNDGAVAVTYGGVSATEVTRFQGTVNFGESGDSYVFIVKEADLPADGANTVAVTWDVDSGTSDSTCVALASQYAGVDQTTPSGGDIDTDVATAINADPLTVNFASGTEAGDLFVMTGHLAQSADRSQTWTSDDGNDVVGEIDFAGAGGGEQIRCQVFMGDLIVEDDSVGDIDMTPSSNNYSRSMLGVRFAASKTPGVTGALTKNGVNAGDFEVTNPSGTGGVMLAISMGRYDGGASCATPADAGSDDWGSIVVTGDTQWRTQHNLYKRNGDSDDATWATDSNGEQGVYLLRYADGDEAETPVGAISNLSTFANPKQLPVVPNADIDWEDFLVIVVATGHHNLTPPNATLDADGVETGYTEVEEWVGSAEWYASSFVLATWLVTGHDTGTDYDPGEIDEDTALNQNLMTILVPTASGAVLTSEQTHFQFINDDGSETTATDMEAEDTDTTLAAGDDFRLRIQVDTTLAGATVTPVFVYRRLSGPDRWRIIKE